MHIKYKDTNRVKVKGRKKLYHGSINHKKARMAISLIISERQIKTRAIEMAII